MKNIIKIFSLIVTIVAGLISILFIILSYGLYTDYQAVINLNYHEEYVENSHASFFVGIAITIFAALISLIAFYIFWHLHKNQPQNEENYTLLDYDENAI
jgi:uncharacterized BrkB/YihY/UPF0761 family membrane protein